MSLKITGIRPGSCTEKDLLTRRTKGEAGYFRSGSDIVAPFRASTDCSPTLQNQRKMQRAPQACPTQPTSKSSLLKKIPHPLPKKPPSKATRGDIVRRKLDTRKKTPIISKRDTGPPRLPETRYTISKTSSFKTERTYSFAKSSTSNTTKDDLVVCGGEPEKKALTTMNPDTAALHLSKISFTNTEFSLPKQEHLIRPPTLPSRIPPNMTSIYANSKPRSKPQPPRSDLTKTPFLESKHPQPSV
jgi:hypothetical protein